MAAPAVAPAVVGTLENDAAGHGVVDPLGAVVHFVAEQVVPVVVVEVTNVEARAEGLPGKPQPPWLRVGIRTRERRLWRFSFSALARTSTD